MKTRVTCIVVLFRCKNFTFVFAFRVIPKLVANRFSTGIRPGDLIKSETLVNLIYLTLTKGIRLVTPE